MLYRHKITRIFFLMFFFTGKIHAQYGSDMMVDILASGRADTKELATQEALKSAVMDVYDVMIAPGNHSAAKSIPDEEITYGTNGIIQRYDVLDQREIPGGDFTVTSRVIVSMRKLTSFMQMRGYGSQVNFSVLDLKAKQFELRSQNEIKIVGDMVAVLHEMLQASFDFSLQQDTTFLNNSGEAKHYHVWVVANKQMNEAADYFNKILTILNQANKELKNYRIADQELFPVKISFSSQESECLLQQQVSVIALNAIAMNWGFYQKGFNVLKSRNLMKAEDGRELFNFADVKEENGPFRIVHGISFHFPSIGDTTAQFDLTDNEAPNRKKEPAVSLQTLGVRSKIKHGGYVIFEDKHGHGLVAAITDVGQFNGELAKKCEGIPLMGYDDWSLPGKVELNAIFQNLCRKGIGGFNSENPGYWSFETGSNYNTDIAGYLSVDNGHYIANNTDRNRLLSVRLVRKF